MAEVGTIPEPSAAGFVLTWKDGFTGAAAARCRFPAQAWICYPLGHCAVSGSGPVPAFLSLSNGTSAYRTKVRCWNQCNVRGLVG